MSDLPTVDIKGKEYVLVKDRIMAFNSMFPTGAIKTELVSYENGQAIVKAIVTPDVKVPERVFTGYSQAKEGDSYINKMAALENAETSAAGRALAMLGIGVIESVASADEMHKAGATTSVPHPKTTAPVKPTEPIRNETDDEREMREALDEEDTEVSAPVRTCPLHGGAMKARESSYGTFYSHSRELTNGKWDYCSGKGWKSEMS